MYNEMEKRNIQPTIEGVAKQDYVRFLVTAEEKKAINKLAKENSLTVSAYCRRKALGL